MSPEFSAVVESVDAYLASDDFWTLWNRIAGPSMGDLVVEGMSEQEQQRYDALYELVYMGQPERATLWEHSVGLRGGPDLRTLIQAWRADVGRLNGRVDR